MPSAAPRKRKATPSTFVRDAGDIPLPAGRVRRGLLYRFSGALLQDADLRTLEYNDVRLVVDLRGHHEGRASLEDWARRSGVEYHHEPIQPSEDEVLSWASGMSAEEARRWLQAAYRQIVDHHGARFAAAIAKLSRHFPSAFGCAAGKDRTGLLAALIQTVLGASHEEIVTHYLAAAPPAEFLGPVASRWIKGRSLSVGSREILSTQREAINVTLEYIDRTFGGGEAYLVDSGLDSESLGTLRQALVVRNGR